MFAHPEVLAVVAGFDPGQWQLVRFQLWRTPPAPALHGPLRVYGVGHVSAARAPA